MARETSSKSYPPRGNRRGRGSRNGSGNNASISLFKQFAPHSAGRNKHATYSTVKDLVCQHIQKSYKNGRDVSQSLIEERVMDLTALKPTRQVSKKSHHTTQTAKHNNPFPPSYLPP